MKLLQRLLVILLFACTYYNLNAQQLMTLPLSAGDSGEIQHNDSLYKFYLTQQDYKEASRYLDKNAMLYWKHNYFDQAISYFRRSIQMNSKLQNFDGIAKINTNMALIFTDKGQYDSAYKYFENTLAVRKAQNQKIGIISALINESVVLNKLQKYDTSIQKLEEALELARELNDIQQMRSCYGMLAETYQKAGNVDKSMYYYNFFKTFNDYVTEQELKVKQKQLDEETYQRKIAELQAENQKLLLIRQQHELEQQQQKITNLTQEQQRLLDSLTKKQLVVKVFEQQSHIQQLENQRLKQEHHRKNLILSFILFFLIVAIIISIVLLRMYRRQKLLAQRISQQNVIINDQKEELQSVLALLQEKHERITDSITYASAIQKAMFSRNVPLKDITLDHFLYYSPKDIVSGDFIYTAQVDDKAVIALGDCTGHGVPGAFLTIVGYNLLDVIIRNERILSPEKIVKLAGQRFYQVLNQVETGYFDGMELSVCVIDKKRSILQFASENTKLIITHRQGEYEIYKGTRHPFGFAKNFENKKFSVHTIALKYNTWYYLFSDGIVHQFNNEFKKFSLQRLTSLLSSIHEKSGEEKYQIVTKTFAEWMQGTEQIDDMTLIGFRVL